MIASSHVFLAIAVLLSAAADATTGCSRSAPAQGGAPPAMPVEAAAEPTDARSSAVSPAEVLHVFATVKHTSEEMPPGLRLCDVHGATLLCGSAAVLAVRGSTIVRDRALEAGLPREPDGSLDASDIDVVGSWPDDAWLLLKRWDVPPPTEVTVFRWDGSRWVVALPKASVVDTDIAVRSWGPGAALLVRGGTFDGSEWLRGIGRGSGIVPRIATAGGCRPSFPGIGPVATFGDGSLALVTSFHCSADDEVLETWSRPGARAVVRPLPHDGDAGVTSGFAYGIAGRSATDLIVFGGEHRSAGPDRNYLGRFDGNGWERLEPPVEGSGILSYAADPSGGAWAVVDAKRSLWHRGAGGWQPVPLPLAGYEAERVTVADDGTVWVRASGPVTYDDAGRKTVGFDVALFSTRAPSHVVELPAPGPQIVGSP